MLVLFSFFSDWLHPKYGLDNNKTCMKGKNRGKISNIKISQSKIEMCHHKTKTYRPGIGRTIIITIIS